MNSLLLDDVVGGLSCTSSAANPTEGTRASMAMRAIPFAVLMTCAATSLPSEPLTRTLCGAAPLDGTLTSTTSSRSIDNGLNTNTEMPFALVSIALATAPTESVSTAAN